MNVVSSSAIQNFMLTQCVGVAELARLAGVHPAVISKILRRDSPCRLPTIAKIASALQVKPAEILKEM